MKLFSRPIDLTGVSTVVYHLPDGPALSLRIEGIEEYLDLELELGHVCDNSRPPRSIRITRMILSEFIVISLLTSSIPPVFQSVLWPETDPITGHFQNEIECSYYVNLGSNWQDYN